MSNKKLLLRRGSEDEHNSFIGDVGEITYVTGTTLSDPEIRIHDGSTPGGIRVRGVTSAGTLSNARNINVADGAGGLLETGWSISAAVGTSTEILTVNGHLYPNDNDAYDLGNAEYKFRDLYLSDATIYFGEEGVTDKEQFATLSIDRADSDNPVLSFKKRKQDSESFRLFTEKDLTLDDDISGDIEQDRVKVLKPRQIKNLITSSLSGVAGGMDYKGGLNPSSLPVDFENSNKGDLYVIQSAGTLTAGGANIYFDQGDHLIVKAEGGLGGTLTGLASKIDKLDTKDRVTSVAGRTGAISLGATDVDGLADVATSGLLGDLNNVAFSELGNGQVLTYSGGTWSNSDVGVTSLNDITDVNTPSPSKAQALVWTGSQWEGKEERNFSYLQSNVTHTITSLSHYVFWVLGGNNVQRILTVDGVPDPSTPTHTFSDSVKGARVTLANFGNVTCQLKYRTTTVNVDPGRVVTYVVSASTSMQRVYINELDHLADVSTSGVTDGQALIYNDTNNKWQPKTLVLNDISNVSGSPTEGQVLTYSSGTWAPAAPAEGGGGGGSDTVIEFLNLNSAPTESKDYHAFVTENITLPLWPSLQSNVTFKNYSSSAKTVTLTTGNVVYSEGAPAGATSFTIEPRFSKTFLYRGTAFWENTGGVVNLSELIDVNIASATGAGILSYDGSEWIKDTLKVHHHYVGPTSFPDTDTYDSVNRRSVTYNVGEVEKDYFINITSGINDNAGLPEYVGSQYTIKFSDIGSQPNASFNNSKFTIRNGSAKDVHLVLEGSYANFDTLDDNLFVDPSNNKRAKVQAGETLEFVLAGTDFFHTSPKVRSFNGGSQASSFVIPNTTEPEAHSYRFTGSTVSQSVTLPTGPVGTMVALSNQSTQSWSVATSGLLVRGLGQTSLTLAADESALLVLTDDNFWSLITYSGLSGGGGGGTPAVYNLAITEDFQLGTLFSGSEETYLINKQTGSSFNFELPNNAPEGYKFTIKRIDSNAGNLNITQTGGGANFEGNLTSLTMSTSLSSITLISDGQTPCKYWIV